MMNEAVHKSRTGKGPSVGLWVVQILLAAAFLAAGGAKLAGAPDMVKVFDVIGVGQWFRYLAGALEVAGAIALLVPGAAFYGAALLAAVMCGALFAHAAILGVATALPPFVLLLLAGTVAYFRRARG